MERYFVLLEHSIGHISKGVGWLPWICMNKRLFFCCDTSFYKDQKKKKSMFTLFGIFVRIAYMTKKKYLTSLIPLLA